MVHSGFCEYEAKILHSPAWSRQENAIFTSYSLNLDAIKCIPVYVLKGHQYLEEARIMQPSTRPEKMVCKTPKQRQAAESRNSWKELHPTTYEPFFWPLYFMFC